MSVKNVLVFLFVLVVVLDPFGSILALPAQDQECHDVIYFRDPESRTRVKVRVNPDRTAVLEFASQPDGAAYFDHGVFRFFGDDAGWIWLERWGISELDANDLVLSCTPLIPQQHARRLDTLFRTNQAFRTVYELWIPQLLAALRIVAEENDLDLGFDPTLPAPIVSQHRSGGKTANPSVSAAEPAQFFCLIECIQTKRACLAQVQKDLDTELQAIDEDANAGRITPQEANRRIENAREGADASAKICGLEFVKCGLECLL